MLAIDARRHGPGAWHVYTRGGRDDEGMDAIAWAARGEELLQQRATLLAQHSAEHVAPVVLAVEAEDIAMKCCSMVSCLASSSFDDRTIGCHDSHRHGGQRPDSNGHGGI